MELLHPVFTIATIILIGFSILEGYGEDYRNYKAVWVIIAMLIILTGFRIQVGADYGSYLGMYPYYGLNSSYSQVWSEALLIDDGLDVEWLYVLINKVFFDLRIPFFFLTMIMALISIIPKFYVFEKNSVYPALCWLLYMFPSYFSGDSGQMRQGAAMGFVLLAFEFVKKRKLLYFVAIIYIAIGFHKSAVIFLPAYWLATIPMKRNMILGIILICVALSPFQVYNYISILDSIAPQEIYSGFSNYSSIEAEESSGGIKFTDLICAMYTFYIFTFDKEGCAKIPYYEYLRNIGAAGICLYFIFRGSPIFSTRLTSIYLVFNAMVVTNIVASISSNAYRRYLYTILIFFVIFYYFVYAHIQADKASFTTEKYQNILW